MCVGDLGRQPGAVLAGEHHRRDRVLAGQQVKPASVISSRNSAVLARSGLARLAASPAAISSALSDPAATLGATALENR